jgi:mannose-6-phosphate isomerase-like protein (cupin superfamily)
MAGWTKKNLAEIPDVAEGAGLSEYGEARFARTHLDAADTGLAYHVLKPGKRQGFGHRHDAAEELHVILSGSGRVKLDDDIVELEPLDALRLAPEVNRRFEAGPEGLTFLVFGPHHEKDGAIDPDFWAE